MHVFCNNLYNKQKDQDISNIILHKHHIMKKKMKYEKCQGCFLRAGSFRMEEQVSVHVFCNNLYNKQKDQDITNIILHKHHIMKKKMKYEKCQGCFLRAGAFRMEEQVS